MKARHILLILALLASFPQGGIAQTNSLAIGGWGEIAWGSGTNGVCVGLQVETRGNNPLVTNRFDLSIFLKNLTEKRLVFVVPNAASEITCALPDGKSELGFVITDSRGARVGQIRLKRGAAKALPPFQKISPGTPSTSLERVFLNPKEITFYRGVNLAEYLDTRKPGRYQIQIDLRLQTLGDDWVLAAFALPPAATAVTKH